MSRSSSPSSRRDRGLTLIELIVVMAILVVLTGLALPKLDVFKLKANKAQGASNMYAVNNWVEAYWTTHDQFPDNFDSLLQSNSGPLYTKLHPSLTGGVGGNATKLALSTPLTAGEVQSLARVGLTSVVDHDPLAEVPNNSDDILTKRVFAVGDVIATLNPAEPKVADIVTDFYPASNGVIPAGKKLAVFGVGRFNEMIGDTLHVAPFYANADQTAIYTRFLVVFEVDGGGSRARLLGSLASDGDRIEEEIQEFYE